MRKIELKQIEKLDYRELLKALVTAPAARNGSMSLDEMRRAVKILDALDRAGDTLLLEDADWVFVKDRVANAQYVRADSKIVDFADHVINAVKTEVVEVGV